MNNETIVEDVIPEVDDGVENFAREFRAPGGIRKFNRLVLRDLNANEPQARFSKYTQENITKYLSDPSRYEKELRGAVVYLYGASSHFRRLIQYFASLSDMSYVVSPYKIDTSTAKPNSFRRNYHKVLNMLSSMDIRSQFEKVKTVVLREDVFYGTFWESPESIILQQLPSDYCKISVIEDNVLNVSFDFSYFKSKIDNLELYPAEFTKKYNLYANGSAGKWQELDAPNSFAVKCNTDILSYAVPPFAGILREIYDLENYKQLKLTKTEIDNYALLAMNLGVNEDGSWKMNLDRAKKFYHNLDDVVPDEIGTVLTPMPIEKISLERNHADKGDTVADAEQNLFTAAGVSSLLFNNEKASSNALLLSVKADQALTFGIVKSIETVLNRFIRRHPFGKYFKVTFLDCSPFNRKELSDAYLKAGSYGLPMVSYYCAAQGMLQDEMDCMNFLEDDVLDIKNRFIPLMNSSTQSGSVEPKEGAGRPKSEIGDLTDNGEISQERDDE